MHNAALRRYPATFYGQHTALQSYECRPQSASCRPQKVSCRSFGPCRPCDCEKICHLRLPLADENYGSALTRWTATSDSRSVVRCYTWRPALKTTGRGGTVHVAPLQQDEQGAWLLLNHATSAPLSHRRNDRVMAPAAGESSKPCESLPASRSWRAMVVEPGSSAFHLVGVRRRSPSR